MGLKDNNTGTIGANGTTEDRKQRLERIMTSVARGTYSPSSKLVANKVIGALERLAAARDRVIRAEREDRERFNNIVKGRRGCSASYAKSSRPGLGS